MSRHFVLPASPATVHWGYFDAKLRPVLTIRSGDTVTMETVNGGPEILPSGDAEVLPEQRSIHEALKPEIGSHILTGPVAVEGAEPGDVLEVSVLFVELRQNWGFSAIKPGLGTLPNDFPNGHLWHSAIDVDARVATLPWGASIDLHPFFGIMGVAPASARGRQSSVVPAEFGGNIDCKELVAGTTLHLPVWTPGALFSTGDGHAVQGDGEVCLTALETALSGTFRFVVRKGAGLSLPMIETPTHVGTLAFDPDLDEAARTAVRSLIALIQRRSGLTAEEAYMLCSLAADLRVTQLVDGSKGIHALLDRRWLRHAS